MLAEILCSTAFRHCKQVIQSGYRHQTSLMLFHPRLPVLFLLLIQTTIRPIKLEWKHQLRYLKSFVRGYNEIATAASWKKKKKRNNDLWKSSLLLFLTIIRQSRWIDKFAVGRTAQELLLPKSSSFFCYAYCIDTSNSEFLLHGFPCMELCSALSIKLLGPHKPVLNNNQYKQSAGWQVSKNRFGRWKTAAVSLPTPL